MKPIVVQKYGGSSVSDTEAIQKVARRVAATAAEGKRVVVVVSAMGKSTDGLIEKANAVSASPSRRELDMLLSCGERVSMSLLSMGLSVPADCENKTSFRMCFARPSSGATRKTKTWLS